MSIISALKSYLQAYSGLDSGKPVWVNYLDEVPINYAIVPLAGPTIISENILGNSERQYSFAFQSAMSTADELERLENLGFYEAFAEWLEAQSETEEFPTLESGKTPTKIAALGQGYLFEQGESANGVYQIQCALYYDQEV